MINRIKTVKKNYLFLFLAILSVHVVFAQSNVKDSVQLSDVVVTGSKIEISRKIVPLSVSQLSKQDIENSGQINILPALNMYTPGVFVTERNILGFGVSNTGAGAITMRGISSSPNTDVLVLIDGHPQYQGIFGHPLADAYVASDVEKVEIIRGPASILYGSNAMAGVINIITKKQKEDGFQLNLGTSYGSFNTQKYFGTIGYKRDKLSAYASVNHDQTDGIIANTDFNITNGYAKVGYEINNHFDVIADFSIAKYYANDNGPVNQPPIPFNIDITRGKTALSIDNKFDTSEGGFKFYHNFGMHVLSDGFRSTDNNSGAMLFQTFKLATRTTLTAGADFKQYGGIANQGFKHDSLITVNELAAYAYVQQTLFEKLTVSAGLRLENNSKFGNELIPIGGLTYNLSNATTFKASVSKGFRSPTIMELYLYAPNPALQPERMINYEISWLQSLLNNHLNLELTVFKVKGDNLIQVVGIGYSAKRENVGSFDNQGIEFSARYRLNRNLYFNANYSYLNLDKPVIAAPRQQVNVGANYSYKIWSLHVSAQYIENLYTSVQPLVNQSYALLNVRLSARPTKFLELYIAGNNLTNSQYQINYGYPMPGINFYGGVNVRF
jgi:iron complex outermembrane receptor protein